MIARILAVIACLAAASGQANAQGLPLDIAVESCAVVHGPGPDSLTILFTVAIHPDSLPGPFSFGAEVGFANTPIEAHDIDVFEVPGGRCQRRPAGQADCVQPQDPCRIWVFEFKKVSYPQYFSCQPFGATACGCLREERPELPKGVGRPRLPGEHYVKLDPGNLIPETDETNNTCTIAFDPVAIEATRWGTVKHLYRD